MSGFVQDLRYAVRGLSKSPAFTVAAVLMLALGIGVNAAVFTVTNAVLFKGFPLVESNERVLYLSTGRGCCVSYPDFEDWRAQAKSFEGMVIVHGIPKTFTDSDGFPETYNTTEVSAGTFKLAGQTPIFGRDFLPSDETPGAPPVVILRYGLWERRYGKDPAIIGRTVRINGAPTTVIGVMPRGFSFPQNADLWVPLAPTPEVRKRENRGQWFVFARLAEGVSIESARAEMETIGRRLGSAYPLTNQGRNLLPQVQTFHEFFIGPNATMIYRAMLGAVGLVLLIACANLANLLLARAMGRSRETWVRIALGAGRWRIARQFIIESVMISSLGGFFGWCIATVGVRVFALTANGPSLSDNIGGSWFDNTLDYAMDYRVFAYLVVISIGTGLLFGLAPVSRLANLNINATLKDGGRGATGGRRGKRLSTLLVIAEMALAVVLLAGAGVMIRSFLNIYTADLGFNTENIVTALFELPKARYPDADAQISFYDRLEARMEGIAGVQSVAISSGVPTGGSSLVPYELAGASSVDEQRLPTVSRSIISPSYFRTLGVSVLSGREFNDGDGVSGAPVALVNQLFARTHWPGEDPVGRSLRLVDGKSPQAWLTVVGVVPNVVHKDRMRQEFAPSVYVSYRQQPMPNLRVLVRTRVATDSLGHSLRREVQAIDADLPIIIGPQRLTELLAESYQYRATTGGLFLTCAAIALLLASVGLYAVIAHSVSQRTQEIGVRMAMGATSRDILTLVFTQGMLPVAIGLPIGLAASFAVNHVLKSQLVQVSPSDPITLIAASATLIVSATLGSLLPARRAARVDPLVALRYE